MDRMNILVFNYEYPPIGGGGGWINALVAEELARSHRVTVLTSAYRELPRRERRNGVDVRRLWVPGRKQAQVASLRSLLFYPLTAYRAGMRLTARERFDVVHGNFAVPTGPASVGVARRRGIPHVLSVYGGDLYDPSNRLSPHRVAPVRRTVTEVLRRSDVVVAGSTDTRENVFRYFDYGGAVELIPLGISAPPPTRADRTTVGLPEDAFLTVTVGRLVPRKGIDGLLRVLARPGCASVHLIIVGDGPERQALGELARSLGVEERVRFTGYVEETRKWEILHCSDLYVSGTLHEGFGLVYVEAMMAGLPVVTYDHGGHTDFLRDGETGRIVPAGDEDGLAAAIARFVREPELARRIGERNRSASGAYRVERCAARYEEIFRRLTVSEKSQPHPVAATHAT